VLGVTAIINPLDISSHILQHDFIWMLGLTLLLFPMIYFGKKISRFNGLTLLICYFTYIALLFLK
jgi:cation:H+ antiporter